MTITVEIDTSTPEGKLLEKELRLHPNSVRFIESDIVSDAIPEGYLPLKTGFEEVRNHVKSLYNENSEPE